MEEPKICVVGAGIVGLTTATLLQDQISHAQVTIIADKFLRDTTSDGAAGIFRPSSTFKGPNKDITLKWVKDSYSYYMRELNSVSSKAAKQIGIERRKVCMTSTKSLEAVKNPILEEILDDYHFLSEEEVLERFGKGSRLFSSTYTTLVVDCRKYLPYLTKRFISRGGRILMRTLKSFRELADDFDIIFNCSGLGSQSLCEDHSMAPIRGQVYKVYAPWIKEALYFDSDTYIIPGLDGVVTLGGTRQFESTNDKVDKHDSAAIWERCTNAEHSLRDAQILREWVGFRPYRPCVRVEKEIMKFSDGKSLKIVHNYGHGGYGVTSAPGTSMYAVTLGLELLKNSPKSKL